MTPETVAAAAALVRDGESIGLNLALTEIAPPLFGRDPIAQDVFATDRNTLDDRLDSFYPQGSTQWDGLRHVRAREFGFFGGVTDEFGPDDDRLGIGHWTRAGIVGRGVLLDVAGAQRLPPDHAITRQELEQVASIEGVDVSAGDVVLVRTGYGALWTDGPQYLHGAGISAAGSRWLAEREVRAVGADNMAWDVIGPTDPELGVTLPGHVLLLVRAGIPIIENLNLEELAEARVHEFAFVCLPLKIRGATGSPVRPIALA
jgi:kynurenine formamidase